MPHRLAVLIIALLFGGCKMLKTDINDSAKDLARRYAAKYEHCPYLIESMIRQESMGRPLAESPKGAQGLMQIMPATARFINKESVPTNTLRTDIELNIRTSMKLLRHLHDRYGDWGVVCGCYNTGRPIINGYAKFCESNIDYQKNWIYLKDV
jgi:soluble lytic murein transglycosylase-like protein